MSEITITLPYPPSVNHYWDSRAVRSKKTNRLCVIKYLSARAKSFRKECDARVKEQIGIPPKLKGRLAVIVHQHYKATGQRQDIDNCLKPLFDALEWCRVYQNDEQIDELLVVRKRRAAEGRVEVVIKTIGD